MEMAEKYGGVVCRSVDELLAMDLDAVSVCVANAMHAEITIKALNAGKHVLCEKPMAWDAAEAQQMVEAAKKIGVVAAVNFHNRYYPIPYQMRRMVMNGDLGDVFHVQGGYLQDWLQFNTDFSWKTISEKCGRTRVTADLGSHWIDLAEYVSLQRVKEVFAEFKTVYPTRIQQTKDGPREVTIDTEDFSCILLRFDGGAVGTASFSALVHHKLRTRCQCSFPCF